MRAEIIFKDYTIDVVIHPSCATESDFTVNITTGVGPQGYTPKRGIDYWTDEDKNTVIAQAETAAADAAETVAADTAKSTANAILSDPAYKASIKGDKGDTGDPGYTPVRGVDYWTETDKEEIVAEATPERGVDYWTAADQQAIAAEAQSAAEVAAEATATDILNDPAYKASIKGDKGNKGDTGDPGYTPKRGIDYWTNADKEEIITDATPVRGVDYWTDADKQIVSTQAEEAAEVTAATMLSDPEYKASIKGDPGEPGYTPVKGIDYFDGQDGVPGKDGQDGQPGRDGQNGAPGQDGISPTITITDITGGHRVTITDADGAHSFDVMDGDAADAPVQSVNGQIGAVVLDAQDVGAGTYSKPTGGIPASDLAAGVIPEVPVQDVQVGGVSVLSSGVANVPIATNTALGVVLAGDGLQMSSARNGKIMLAPASSAQIKGGIKVNVTNDISKQHESTFYGLAKAAGSDEKNSTLPVGQYTESAKSAISEMLNGSVTVSGTTPTINALPGIRYVCGEVTTLDIALPASGIVDVVFKSGSTPAVLTVTPPTGMTMQWSNGFDPASLEADTTYEINVMDGCMGVAASWT